MRRNRSLNQAGRPKNSVDVDGVIAKIDEEFVIDLRRSIVLTNLVDEFHLRKSPNLRETSQWKSVVTTCLSSSNKTSTIIKTNSFIDLLQLKLEANEFYWSLTLDSCSFDYKREFVSSMDSSYWKKVNEEIWKSLGSKTKISKRWNSIDHLNVKDLRIIDDLRKNNDDRI